MTCTELYYIYNLKLKGGGLIPQALSEATPISTDKT